MDEFNDLEQELEKLKDDFSVQDEWSRHFNFPATGDYWRRRLEEEKTLWDKKLAAQEEEKKALASRLEQQQDKIDKYTQELQEIERKFDTEAKQWEERLRAKEADLLLEKNRLLWEEKVRQSDFENKELLKQIGELNSKISGLKTEKASEKDAYNESFTKEKNTFEERAGGLQKQISILETRSSELEGMLEEKSMELDKIRIELKESSARAEDKIQSFIRGKELSEKEKASLGEEIVKLKKQYETEKTQAEKNISGILSEFSVSLKNLVGCASGLLQFMSSSNPAKQTWDAFTNLIQKIEDEAESFAKKTNTQIQLTGGFSSAVLLSEDDLPGWEKAFSNLAVQVNTVAAKDIVKNIASAKPRLAVISSKYLKCALKIKKRWNFLPVIIAGDLKPRKAKKILSKGITLIKPPYLVDEITAVLANTAAKSIARVELWDNIKVKRYNTNVIIAAAAVISMLMFAIPYMPQPDVRSYFAQKTVSSPTPYLQPTNIAFDGKDIWTCDWFGQSIYKHEQGGKMKLLRIFNFPGKHFAAITWADGYLWSIDPWRKKLTSTASTRI